MDILERDALVSCRALEDYAERLHELADRERLEQRFNLYKFLNSEATQADKARERILKALNLPTR